MSQGDAHGDKDDGELADLRHREPRQQACAAAIAHVAHDGHDDQRVTDEHEQRQYGRRQHFVAEGGKLEFGAKVDEEEQQQEVTDTGQSCANGFSVGCRGERETGHEGTGFLGEAGPFTQSRKSDSPGDGKQQQQLLRTGDGRYQRWQNPAHQNEQQDGRRAYAQPHAQDDLPESFVAFRASQSTHHHHCQHDCQVLDDEEAHRDSPVQRVQLSFVGEQLDDDDGAGEGQCNGHIECFHVAFA